MFEKRNQKKEEKRLRKLELQENKFNRIKPSTNVIFNVILAVLAAICIIP